MSGGGSFGGEAFELTHSLPGTSEGLRNGPASWNARPRQRPSRTNQLGIGARPQGKSG